MNEELIRIKRPRRLSGLPLPEILGIFVLDGSGSMSEEIARGWTKADAVSEVYSWRTMLEVWLY